MRVISSVSPIDKPIEDAAAERPGEPIRIRLQPAIMRKAPGAKTVDFKAWRQLHWMLELPSLDEARAFRETLGLLFLMIDQHGIGAVHEHLQHFIPSGTK